MFRTRLALMTWLLLLLSAPVVCGQDTPESGNRLSTLRVSAEATVLAEPDQARLEVGVVTQAGSAEAASAENARRTEAAMTAVRRVLGSMGRVRTVGFSVRPEYRYPKEGGTPTIAGYTASNVIEVVTGNLAYVGRLVDAATASGANTIQRLEFTLENEQPVKIQALREAAVKAKQKAEAAADAIGLRIVRVLTVEEEEAPPRPVMQRALAAARTETPVEPGTVEIRARLSLTVVIGSK